MRKIKDCLKSAIEFDPDLCEAEDKDIHTGYDEDNKREEYLEMMKIFTAPLVTLLITIVVVFALCGIASIAGSCFCHWYKKEQSNGNQTVQKAS